MKVIILAGGFGTRLSEYTKTIPKPMIQICGKPIITYIITKTISGNIALSLGMIGALSIVRFRHPVKSALELVIYFALITIGIAASVRTKWAIQLVICTILIILIVKIIQTL